MTPIGLLSAPKKTPASPIPPTVTLIPLPHPHPPGGGGGEGAGGQLEGAGGGAKLRHSTSPGTVNGSSFIIFNLFCI